ncbi:phosphatase regulator like HEAT repeats containing that folds into a alpha-alpha superhelix [Cryptosporidium sp. chipmunk genotype I]|uniref:phosphatase regulator like HEAT repeats containing that folds into a alpha-alpha superhelix n=1 Tax=Cryptosporidium sp. chipmunk genotype I TaxID=1280935 RepID=UPI00351A2EC3|nr:phosphatase regulator like HEAT repeats containing that folds into a alpha-alpha superhelix [Cryptosporidium sp. chipmunk genotype I]
MDRIQKKKNSFRVTEICSYNKSFDEFIKTRSEEELKNILTSCLNSSTIVKNIEGQTFISRVISKLSIYAHDELVNTIQSFVPKLSSNLLVCYGNILYILWLEYNNQNNEKRMQNLEEVIQKTFCIGSIRLNPVIALRMRLILHSFHSNRDDFRVNKLLLRLYDPIIWRYLSVANWKVRLNTTALLAILFPLIDPSLSSGDYNLELDNQFSILQNLLIDNHSEVRVAAIQSVCRILTLYWEITPIERIHEILSILSLKCIEDKHSSNSRVAVINGINVIINNPLSQKIINDYLPKIFTYLHDLDIEVRYSVALLILKISRIQGFDYSKIISKKQVLSRISKEFVIYQLKQSTFFLKYGRLCKNSGIVIGEIFTSDQESVFESLKVARVLAELLNPSIFNEKTKEQLKNCYFFSDLCPIGMVGYFCSLKILVDENIGKNIENSDLLRLAVLLFTTTIENYQKDKITYNKAKILLASSKEILSIVFSSKLSLLESNQGDCVISKFGDKAVINTIKIAIKYFTNTCNDDFLLKINSNDKIWISVLQLLQHQTVLGSSYYPKFSKKVISEFWNNSLSAFRNRLNEKSARIRLGTIILLLKNWGVLESIVPVLANNACKVLSNELSADHEFNTNFDTKLTPNDSRALCINMLLNILEYNEVREYLSNNSSIVSCLERLTKSILNIHINKTSLELELDLIQLTKKLLIYSLTTIKNEQFFYEFILIIIQEIECIKNDTNRSFDKFLLLLEVLGIVLSIPNSNLSNEKRIIEEILRISENLSIIINILEKSDRSEVFEIRLKQRINTYLFALKQIVGSSYFESDIFVKEIRSKLDKSSESNK